MTRQEAGDTTAAAGGQQLLSTADVASWLGVSRRQVQRLADDDVLAVVEVDGSRRFWFDADQVAQVAAERGVGPGATRDDGEGAEVAGGAAVARRQVAAATERAVRAEAELEAARAEIARLKAAVRALTGE